MVSLGERMTRWMFAGLALCLAFFFGGQAARAGDFCANVNGEMSAAEIRRLREDVLDVIPMQNYALAASVTIQNVETTREVYAPEARRVGDQGGYEILVPDRFRALQCHLATIHILVMTGRFDEMALEGLATECARLETVNKLACIYAAPQVLYQHSYDKLGDGVDDLIADFARAAFVNLILHEYGHIVLGHLERRPADMEIEADAFAAVYGEYTETRGQFGLFTTFSALSFADEIFPVGPVHPAFVCRAQALNIVMSGIENDIGTLRKWAMSSPEAYRDVLAEGVSPVSNMVSSERLRKAQSFGCATSKSAVLANISADLQRLRRETAQLNADELSDRKPDALEFVARLNAVKLRSFEGRYLRGKMLSLRLRKVANGLGETITQNRYNAAVEALTEGPESSVISAGDFGRLSALLVLHDTRPFKSDILREQDHVKRLMIAIKYNPKFVLSYLSLALSQLKLEQCDEAFATLDELVARGDSDSGTKQTMSRIRQQVREGVASKGCKGFVAAWQAGEIVIQ